MNAEERAILDDLARRHADDNMAHTYCGIPLSEMTKDEVIAVFHSFINDSWQLSVALDRLYREKKA
jgi:hypothetical protein